MKENVIIGCIVVILAIIGIGVVAQKNSCESKGGILMRGAFGNVCVNVKVVK